MVVAGGDMLVVQGPSALASELLARRAEIIALLNSPQTIAEAEVALAIWLRAHGN